MFTGWFYVCAGEVISWFKLWEQGVESSNLSVPTSNTPVQRLILEINKSRVWGFIRLRARLGEYQIGLTLLEWGLTVFYKTPNHTLKVRICMLVFFCDRNEIKRFLWRRTPRN